MQNNFTEAQLEMIAEQELNERVDSIDLSPLNCFDIDNISIAFVERKQALKLAEHLEHAGYGLTVVQPLYQSGTTKPYAWNCISYELLDDASKIWANEVRGQESYYE